MDNTHQNTQKENQQNQKKQYFFQKKPQIKKKQCKFCLEKIKEIDWRQSQLIKLFTTETGRILPRKITGVCAKHQRQLAKAIKINRNLAILPYTTMSLK
ncbi:MAG: 30S ribosomal protein S18 [Elusimicrobiales bacterium]|nr:30S ribosomal protein S18 [Elusimicrobiales bacterium]